MVEIEVVLDISSQIYYDNDAQIFVWISCHILFLLEICFVLSSSWLIARSQENTKRITNSSISCSWRAWIYG